MDSLLEESVFDIGEGSDFSPPKATSKSKAISKAKPAVKKAAAPRAPAKRTLQSTLKPLSKKRPKPDSENEDSSVEGGASIHDESLLSATPPSAKKQKKAPGVKKSSGKPLQEIENGATTAGSPAAGKPKKSSKATDQYQKLTQLEHILKRPDTYIGSVERSEKPMWVFNSETESMEMREISFVPGLYKIFDEILVNAADNKQRDKNMDTVRVTFDREKGEISVMNNGRGIPIEVHEKEQIYIPELIFGHLLTSSNYDDEEEKVTGGRNGYGAKLCNIFSTEFTLETADARTKKKYKQTWTKNMSAKGKAKITDNKGDDFTKITFCPDFAKFKMDGIDDDFEALVKRRVYDLAGTSRGVKVFLNGEKIKVNSFKKYMEMYTKAIKGERGEEAANDVSEIVTESPNARWEIGFAVSDGSFQQVSFVNSIATTTGGTHVNYVADQIGNKLMDIVKKRNKVGAQLKLNQIKNYIFVFVNCLIVNPAFTSQTKEQLTTKHTQFKSECNVSDDFLKKVANKTQVIQNILDFAGKKADQILKKSDGNRRNRMDNPKLTDANKAGSKDGHRCTLILTEGDSAKGLAVAGRAVVGPDLFGVYPLRGKLLNVRDASVDQISKNVEIQNIKNFMGLKHKTQYDDCRSLRYGHLMIMTDQDHDGSHIKGLLINFLQVAFPSLLRIPGFLIEFITPIVKVYKGDPKRPKASQSFFTMPEYEQWKEEHKDERGWEHKYYKGLGTSSTEDAQVYFRDLDKHLKEFHAMQDNEPELIELAFSKKKADERKEWLRQFKPGTYLDHASSKITYTDFINRELILFSMADNIRSIPSVVDGLKPGQRKVLFTCFKRNLKKDIKVVELAGSVNGLTAYQHGDASMQGTIIGLAQDFVGSNNVNYLEPSGNFGSRLQGGTDAASPRYIYTRLTPFARRVLHAADEALLTYNTDDERMIEPEIYVPVIPMILVNGTDGIGTGWSSSIPNYNPEDIVANLHRMMNGEELEPMVPWFRGFKGTVTALGQDRYQFSGIIRQTGDNEVEVTELPIRMWTQDFKDKLVEIIKAEKPGTAPWIKDYEDYNDHHNVHFVVRLDDKYMKQALEEGLEQKFKLTKSIATSNLVAFDPEGRITKYAGVEDMMKEFFSLRLKFYEKRKAHLLSEMQKDLDKWSEQARFIQMIIDGKLVVSKKKKQVLVAELKAKNFKVFGKHVDAIKEGELAPIVEENDDAEENAKIGASGYDYLLGMPIWSLTQERVEKLMRQIGDKEHEIDALIKLSKEDLWRTDLDDFIKEWRFQLADEEDRRKQARRLGRRESRKLKFGASAAVTKKRKAYGDDDSDFEAGGRGKKSTITKKEPPVVKKNLKQGGLLSHLQPLSKEEQEKTEKRKATEAKKAAASADGKATKSQPRMNLENKPVKNAAAEDVWMDIAKEEEDSNPSNLLATTKATITNKSTKPKVPASIATALGSDPNDSDDDFPTTRPAASTAAGRNRRAATSKPTKYALSDSESDSDGNFDVGKMVRGVPTTATTTSGGRGTSEETSSRPLFSNRASMSRPSSSHGLPKKASTADRRTNGFDTEADDTDYAQLAPSNGKKNGIAVTARSTAASDIDGNNINNLDSDDDEDEDDIFNVAPIAAKKRAKPANGGSSSITTASKSKPITKPGTKAKVPAAATASKTSGTTTAQKPLALSPAAKAYAKKQERAKMAAIPAPSLNKKKTGKNTAGFDGPTSDEDEDKDNAGDDEVEKVADEILDEEEEEEEERVAVMRRPARRAAAAATVATSAGNGKGNGKGRYTVDSDDDEDDDEEESEDFGGAGGEDEEEEESAIVEDDADDDSF